MNEQKNGAWLSNISSLASSTSTAPLSSVLTLCPQFNASISKSLSSELGRFDFQ
jgi:hypothetical protein